MRNPGAVLATASQSFVLFGQSWACRRRCRAAIPSALIVFFFRKDRRSQAAGAIVSPGGWEDAAPGCPTVRRSTLIKAFLCRKTVR